MPDLSQLLRRPAGEAKPPKALPIGDYKAVVKGHEYGDNNQNKTPYVRLALVLTDWPEDMDPADRPEGVELNKRQMRKDFFLTEESLWRLDKFIRTCGIEPRGRMYDEIVPELIGQSITVQIQQYIRNNVTGNNTGDAFGPYPGDDPEDQQ